ncbi:MAG: sigma-54-dependent Fis family transcriptional regulator [Deltaproteobacteria bacterium]|nr:sigma-54-dependent Fis family transcriptional regulator [Deltaproteobacteria bacterium]MBW2018991.1 sigma-54-dependent Fis family transcriptional regulator [Deltaproteobacteria bacterium]MBW2073581.1 sigma-54-dependent Fis family transcriptional regulator [Deltaproteobacteria bacterium]
MKPKILVVDDEPHMLELIQTIISENTSYISKTVSDPLAVIPWLNQERFDLVLLDLRMPGMNGMELLEEIKTHHSHTDVVIVTAYGTIPSAVEAVRKGAFDYITKPFSKDEMLLTVEKVFQWQALHRENLALREALTEKFDLDQLVGASEKIRQTYDHVKRLAGTDTLIYLEGEMGTGKSFLAKAIHYHSPRKGAPFIEVACGAVSQSELETVLFGQKGDGRSLKGGVISKANGGTLYLSDIHSLPLPLQKRLVRFMESREYEPQGSMDSQTANTRLLISSDRNLDEFLRQGLFDQRLYLMLERFRIFLPPLRARREDIPLLVAKFVNLYCIKYGKKIEHISDESIKWFLSRDWPGNIRELENVVERSVVLAHGSTLELKDVYPSDYLNSFIFTADPSVFDLPHTEAFKKSVEHFRNVFELHYLGHCLARYKGNIEKAASHMGVTPEAFRQKMTRVNLSEEAFQRGIL